MLCSAPIFPVVELMLTGINGTLDSEMLWGRAAPRWGPRVWSGCSHLEVGDDKAWRKMIAADGRAAGQRESTGDRFLWTHWSRVENPFGSLLCVRCACCVAVSSINALICVFPNSVSRIYFLPLCGFLYKLPLSAGITEKCSISSLNPFPCFSSQSELFMSFLSFPICFY